MAEVMNMAAESLDHEPTETVIPTDGTPPPRAPLEAVAQRRRDRDRDSRDRGDERDRDRNRDRDRYFDRPPSRHRVGGGDYYDRNLSPPPPPPLRDRERDYKRRRSPGPSTYRERRRSSLSWKRSRRDDGGFDRRGSPGGGFGPDDRRHDYIGGYEREMAGRPGYTDNESYCHFMNRSSGPSELESNHGGYTDSTYTKNAQREGLMSYKQFIQELEDNILPAEAERRYEEYRTEYISTQKSAFFDAHKDEEWLRDKYHPTNVLGVIERRNEHARQMVKDFVLDLQRGTLDLGPSVNASLSNKSGQASDRNSDDEVETSGNRRRPGRGPVREIDISVAPKADPISSAPRRIQADIEQSLALVRKLDSEKGIADNILCSVDKKKDSEKSSGPMGPTVIIRGLTSVKCLEGVELLDTLITYLWRIHGIDYYGMIESNEAMGFRHEGAEGKSYEETSKGSADWEKKIDSFWQERLKGQDPLEILTAKEKIDAAAVKVLDPFVRKIKDEKYGWKYGCGAKGCTKLFHAAEFVQKHLKLKHSELVLELTSKVRNDLYFQNYMNDPHAPGGTPVMQQPPPKDKAQRLKVGLASRLKDDRSNRGESDWMGSDGERFDRSENSPSHDRLSKAGGLERRNLDDSTYDTFGGQDLGCVPPFPSDIPPPSVLMPVPGAGPLGPFVPAPPEVAMRIMRDQGGPSSYEGNGRKKRSGPPVGSPAPIVAATALGMDPRRIRSYQDLDAPEDEITVIDYRSL